MIPTIDVSSIALIAALLKAVHWIIAGARVAGSWFVKAVVGGFIATKFGRALMEFGLFAFIYTTFAAALNLLVRVALGSVARLSLPQSLLEGFDVLNAVIPANSLTGLFGDALTLTITIKNYQFAYRNYHRVASWFYLLMHSGRV